ncbi:flagellar motor protein MotB [Marinisporobacter balticus]|uniref:Chemotaxis protein MotB n=1 Tax=Marinisporobacter balticus TaxID=2018667 RepID=A0A4V2SCL9_9FIRM|nr:flagellar motor protein MotB [Marinisporobacter balticus]TCO79940.1 chemotaxis protein MotB [Marinisporobacter balticus]
MGRKRKQEETKAGSPAWMTTFSDLMTLLLCFFVLLFAFSTIDLRKFSAVMQSFQGSLGVFEGGKTLDSTEYIQEALNDEKTTAQLEEIEDFKKLKEQIEEYLENNEMEQQILVDLDARGLLLRFKDNVLFDSGYAQLKPVAKKTLEFIADLLKQEEFIEKYIRIEGHTDADPIIHSKKFPTNWELSVTRASNVVRFLIEEADMSPQKLSASGYSKYHPVAPNDSVENKAKNRRVDIVILRSEFVKSESYY